MTKEQWRARLLAARRSRPSGARVADQRALSEHLLAALVPDRDAAGPPSPLTVCAYLPLASEPLAPDLPARLAAAGVRVLVPAATPAEPLDWCEFGGPTRPGMLGVAEPTGGRLGPGAIRRAGAVLVPALAVDRRGVRLGRGGGHYDRTLALLAAGRRADDPAGEPAGDPAGRPACGMPRLIAVVFDDEELDLLPFDPHDVRVTEVATPRGGLRHVAPPGPVGASSN